MRTLPRSFIAVMPLAALLLHACGDPVGDQAGDQAGDRPGDPLRIPATPDQIEKLDAVVERFPEVGPMAERARADGNVTEQEIIEVFTEAEKLKEAAGGE